MLEKNSIQRHDSVVKGDCCFATDWQVTDEFSYKINSSNGAFSVLNTTGQVQWQIFDDVTNKNYQTVNRHGKSYKCISKYLINKNFLSTRKCVLVQQQNLWQQRSSLFSQFQSQWDDGGLSVCCQQVVWRALSGALARRFSWVVLTRVR